jgi:hypothetical protein
VQDLYIVESKKPPKDKSLIDNTKLIWVSKDVFFDDTGHAHLVGPSVPQIPVTISPESPSNSSRRKHRARPEPTERSDYTVAQLAAEWNLSTDKIRSLFRDELGVVKLSDKKAGAKRKRVYVTLRIPVEVAKRVKQRLLNA